MMAREKKPVKREQIEVQEVTDEQPQEGEFTDDEVRQLNKHSFWRKLWRLIKVLFWIGILVAGVWYFQQQQIDAIKSDKVELEQQLKDAKAAQDKAEDELADAQKELSTASDATAETVPPLVKQAIVDAISSGKYSELNSYMADKVTFALAASEAQGTITKAQAISQLAYLNSGTSPWNFSIPSSTVIKYKTGNYKAYTGDDVIFGSSANKYFVSFHLDSSNKIDQFFLASSTDLL